MTIQATITEDGRILIKGVPIKGKPGLALQPSKVAPRQRRWQRITPLVPKEGVKEFKASAEGISKELATAAHRGTSFIPEKRAQTVLSGFEQEVQAIYEKLKPSAKTDSQRELLRTEMEKFQTTYAQKENELLSTRSRLVSPMIAGPSKFPGSRMEKLNRAYDNKVEREAEWKKKAIKAIKRKLEGMATEEAGGELEVMKKKIAMAEKLQAKMKVANNIIRKKISDREKVKALMEAGFSKEVAEKLLQPDFAGRKGFAPYQLTNNNARIATMKKRLAELQQRGTEGSKERAFKGGQIVENADIDRLQIIFDAKPSQPIISELKHRGFRWSPKNKAWQRQLTSNARDASKQIVDFCQRELGKGGEVVRIGATITEDGRILAKGVPIRGKPGLVLQPSKVNPRKRRWQKTGEEEKKRKQIIELKPPENFRIRRYKDPVTDKWSYDLLGRYEGQKTWGVYFKQIGNKEGLQDLARDRGIEIKNLPLTSYIWDRKKKGWVKVSQQGEKRQRTKGIPTKEAFEAYLSEKKMAERVKRKVAEEKIKEHKAKKPFIPDTAKLAENVRNLRQAIRDRKIDLINRYILAIVKTPDNIKTFSCFTTQELNKMVREGQMMSAFLKKHPEKVGSKAKEF